MGGKRDLSIPSALGGVMLVALAGAGSFALYMDRRNEKAIEQLCSEIGGLHYVSRSEGAEVYETTPHMLSDEDIRQTGGIYWRETKGF
ncbi:hypothetical protein KY363_01870, partial [Candidatus Woesearchaeota archaeon]|nr:hypothetical protein [Candidatus Woesearchaeota archaeon]